MAAICRGRYLLWHAMNIRSVGPVLTLAADAKTTDGTLNFVGAREEDRALLLDYSVRAWLANDGSFHSEQERFTKMRLQWRERPLHFDDALWPAEDEKAPDQCEIESSGKKRCAPDLADRVITEWTRFCASGDMQKACPIRPSHSLRVPGIRLPVDCLAAREPSRMNCNIAAMRWTTIPAKNGQNQFQHRNVIDWQRNRHDPDAKEWEEQHPVHPFEFGWGEAARCLES